MTLLNNFSTNYMIPKVKLPVHQYALFRADASISNDQVVNRVINYLNFNDMQGFSLNISSSKGK